jgi:hypothetical protein
VRDRSGRITTSRRHLLKGLVAAAALPLIGGVRSAAASSDWAVSATTSWDDVVDLRSEADRTGDLVASLDPGTTVQLLDGPSYEGWYLVDPIHLADVTPGWVPGRQLVFEQRARTFVDQSLLGAPGDWSTDLGPLRRGFTVTLIGPVVGDWVLVRSGERVGYASIWTLETTDGPETDRWAEYWVDVNRSTAEVRLYVGDSMVDLFNASMSAGSGDGFYATAVGTYWIYQKIEGLTYTPYADAYFMYWAGFDPDRFNGFHSWTMDASGNVLRGGWATTAGCVATAPDNAWSIYHFVDIGSRVEIHW